MFIIHNKDQPGAGLLVRVCCCGCGYDSAGAVSGFGADFRLFLTRNLSDDYVNRD